MSLTECPFLNVFHTIAVTDTNISRNSEPNIDRKTTTDRESKRKTKRAPVEAHLDEFEVSYGLAIFPECIHNFE